MAKTPQEPKIKEKDAKKPSNEKTKAGFAKLEKWYKSQLEQKDRVIEKLRAENRMILAVALKQSARTREIFEKAEKSILKKK